VLPGHPDRPPGPATRPGHPDRSPGAAPLTLPPQPPVTGRRTGRIAAGLARSPLPEGCPHAPDGRAAAGPARSHVSRGERGLDHQTGR